ARRVVDHHRSCVDEPRCPLTRGRAAGGEQREVEALDRLVAQTLHDEAAVELAPDGAFRGERDDLRGRELALAQDLEHQRAYLPGRADHRDSVPAAVHRLSLASGRQGVYGLMTMNRIVTSTRRLSRVPTASARRVSPRYSVLISIVPPVLAAMSRSA